MLIDIGAQRTDLAVNTCAKDGKITFGFGTAKADGQDLECV